MSEVINKNGADNGNVEVKEQEHVQWENILAAERTTAPLVDIYETNDDYILTAYMPGVKKENIQLNIENGSLMIFGKIDYQAALNRNYILNESDIANYFRRFKLSDSVNVEKVDAVYENGQLTVKLPKHDHVKPRTISVK